MSGSRLTLRMVKARGVLAPLKQPIRTAVGTIPSAPLVLIDIATEEGVVGRAYIFCYTPAALAPLVSLIETIGGELKGKAVVPFDRMADFDRRFRLIGLQGLIGMAVAGLDMAFWDIIGRAVNEPLARVLGGEVKPVAAYDSFGMIDAKEDDAAIVRSVNDGFKAIKIKIGGGDLAQDVAAVGAVRQMIGPDIALMVDYNQSLQPDETLRRIDRLARFDLTWVEEPVPAEDVHGHARVRAKSPVPIQTGENWWFPRDMANAIAAGASDLAMIDVMKIGGVTGWMRAAALAQAASLPVSSHVFIEASAHLLTVTPTAQWLEHLDMAGSILAEPCRPVDGKVTARGPGLGMDWDEKAVVKLLF